MKGLVKITFLSRIYLDKGAKAQGRYRLPALVGRVKLHNGVIFITGAETADALAAVDIEGPHGRAVNAGYPGEKVSERLREVIVLDYEPIILIEIIFGIIFLHALILPVLKEFVHFFLTFNAKDVIIKD